MEDEEQQAAAHGHKLHPHSFAPLEEHEHLAAGGGAEMIDYMLGQQVHPTTHEQVVSSSFDNLLGFSDVPHFAVDSFGLPSNNLALKQPAAGCEKDGCDGDDQNDGYFFRFQSLQPAAPLRGAGQQQQPQVLVEQESSKMNVGGGISSECTTTTLVMQQLADGGAEKKGARRKRPRTAKTSEEVESQRMTHIAIERDRRRQMNEYLRTLRSLMPGSYVQRGDHASIIGGAIEFIREVEQLIQCLESQKRRRRRLSSSVADTAGAGAPTTSSVQQHHQITKPPPLFATTDASGGSAVDDKQQIILDLEDDDDVGLREEVAENKSCLADIEVRALQGADDAMIKILCRRRRPAGGQLIEIIAALEEMRMTILHANITTVEQTVLYSFNVKIAGGCDAARLSAEDIAGAVHEILSFIDINYTAI